MMEPKPELKPRCKRCKERLYGEALYINGRCPKCDTKFSAYLAEVEWLNWNGTLYNEKDDPPIPSIVGSAYRKPVKDGE